MIKPGDLISFKPMSPYISFARAYGDPDYYHGAEVGHIQIKTVCLCTAVFVEQTRISRIKWAYVVSPDAVGWVVLDASDQVRKLRSWRTM